MGELNNANRRRWGIIYCPKIGSLRPMKRWREIRDYMTAKGVEFDFIQSENDDSVERHARMFADNGYVTVVVVGGDGVLQDALNGIMASSNRGNVTLGIIPNGIANDFAHYWGIDANDYRKAVDCIMAHRVRRVDAGCCAYDVDGVEVRRYFINVLNIGMSARIVELANKKSTIFAKAVYRIRALLCLLFKRQNFHMRFRLNSQVVDKKFMMVCVGNSTGYGMTPSAVPYNGWLDVSAIKMSPLFGMIEGLLMLARKKILNFKLVEPFRTTEMVVESVGGAPMGVDGRPFRPTFPMTVTVEPECVNLIIPIKINKN